MSKIPKWIICLVSFLLITNAAFYSVLADGERHTERKWYQKDFDREDDEKEDHDREEKKRQYRKRFRNDSNHDGKRFIAPVNNPIFKEACGACHFAYQPELLPFSSWDKILAGLEDHFGEVVELDLESKKFIAEYLKANAADHSTAKRAVKIMRSIGKRTPLRITQIPYIQEKHHEIPAEVLNRESVGSLSNCSACHVSAENGIYEDDYVKIPQ